jgi:hypothetical protein
MVTEIGILQMFETPYIVNCIEDFDFVYYPNESLTLTLVDHTAAILVRLARISFHLVNLYLYVIDAVVLTAALVSITKEFRIISLVMSL